MSSGKKVATGFAVDVSFGYSYHGYHAGLDHTSGDLVLMT